MRSMRFEVFLLSIAITLSFTSCSDNNIVNEPEITSSSTDNITDKPEITSSDADNAVDESKLTVINENDYLSDDVVGVSDNQVRFKETISFSEAYPNAVMYDLTNIKKPRDNAYEVCADNSGNIYFDAERSDTEPFGTIYRYNPFEDKWDTLVKTDKDHNCTAIFANEKYLLWAEDKNANWRQSSLHLLNLDTMNDIKFYEFTLDPEMNLMYAWQFSTPVLIGDNIYFDDIVDKDENELYKIQILSYSISQNKVSVLDEDAKWPMEYQNKAAWLKMSQDKKNSLFFSSNQEKCLCKTGTRLGTVFTAKDDLIVANDYMSQALYDYLSDTSNPKSEFKDTVNDPFVSSYGIKILVNGKPRPIIVVNKGFITNAITNGELVGWYGCFPVGLPMLYSYSKDKLIIFDQLPSPSVSSYDFILSENQIILGHLTEDGQQCLYMWDLKA